MNMDDTTFAIGAGVAGVAVFGLIALTRTGASKTFTASSAPRLPG